MAPYVWWSLIAVHVFWALWGLVTDLVLIREQDQSITTYLRANSWAFIIPSVLGLLAWGVLLWHLFWQAR
jgi:hypothetical protein